MHTRCGLTLCPRVAPQQSNPILEAFGNACTLRNHNSSRFGKFITLYFAPPLDGGNAPQISGASIETLLLEKSRVAALSPGERNYHIFYQVQSGDSVSPDMQGPFRILGDNGVGDIEGDAQRREETKEALLALGMKEEEWAEVVRVVGAVMHLGNIEIEADTNSKGSSDVDRAVMRDGGASEAASRLLGVDEDGLREALLTREIRMSDEVVTVCNSKSMSEAARDGVSKALYGNLFTWVVNLINSSLSLGDDGTGSFARVGILDIFGFESFANNSLEQLCINFANEKLQHQFLDFTIKIEQEEYERERIAWDTIVFPDNSGTVALFESRPSGILSLLDEECRVPRGSDSGFALKVRSSNDPLVAAPKMMPGSFIIKHYAQDVTYNTKGFLERNKDQFSPSLLSLLQTTSSPFIRRLFTPEAKQQRQAVSPRLARHKSARVMQESIGSQFKRQLGNLIDRIRETNPHYVRCINPNTTKKAGEFQAETVTTQLRYSGVLEAMRFARTGFPSRFTFKDFASKYWPLLMHGGGLNKRGASAMSPGGGWGMGADEGAARDICVRLLMHEGVQESEAQAGCRKVFLKAGMSNTQTRKHPPTHTNKQTNKQTNTHTHTHTNTLYIYIYVPLPLPLPRLHLFEFKLQREAGECCILSPWFASHTYTLDARLRSTTLTLSRPPDPLIRYPPSNQIVSRDWTCLSPWFSARLPRLSRLPSGARSCHPSHA